MSQVTCCECPYTHNDHGRKLTATRAAARHEYQTGHRVSIRLGDPHKPTEPEQPEQPQQLHF